MSEWTTGQPRNNESQYANRPPPDPAVAAVDAFRAAIVAQTALLRSLSEQVRLNQEAIVNWFSLNRKQQAKVNNQLVGLAERLEKLDQQDDRFLVALEQVGNGHRARLAAIEAKLTHKTGSKEWLRAYYSDAELRKATGRPAKPLTKKNLRERKDK